MGLQTHVYVLMLTYGGFLKIQMLRARDKPQQLSEEVYYLLRVDEEPEQLQDIFATGMKQTAAIEAAHVYLLRSRPKTAAINGFFFLILFPIYCCV